METLSAIDLAQELHGYSQNGFIVIDARNSGMASRWRTSFPSLNSDQMARLGEIFTIRYHSMREAQAAFTQICADVAAADGLMISGTITYVGDDWDNGRYEDCPPTRTYEFEIAEDDCRPVFENGKLTFVEIEEHA